MKDILLFSSGLDSYLGWEYLKRPECLYLPVRHVYMPQELFVIDRLKDELGIDVRIHSTFDFEDLEEDSAFIPARNMYFVLYAANYGDRIFLVTQQGEESYRDTTPHFFVQASKLLTYLYEKKKLVDSPFWRMTKVDSVKWYLDQGLPAENLLKTWSCHHPANATSKDHTHRGIYRDERWVNASTYWKHCGHCNACFRRWIAFMANGIDEDWANDPMQSPVLGEYIRKMKAGEYDKRRAEQTLEVLRKAGAIR